VNEKTERGMTRSTEREERLVDEVLRLAAGCRPADDLLAYHENALAPERRMELQSHLDDCDACRAAIDFLATADAPGEAAEGDPIPLPAGVAQRLEDLMAQVGKRSVSSSSSGSPWLRLAASFLVAASLAVTGWLWLVPDGFDDDPDVLRSSDRLVTLEPVGRLAAPPEQFVWSPHGQASTYTVFLLGESLEEIWSGSTLDAGARLELDGEARRLLASGGRFSWQVVARNRRGFLFDQSAVTQFEIAVPEPTR